MEQRTNQQIEKSCLICMESMVKNKKYSQQQWDKKIFCSRKCCGLSKVGIPRDEETKQKLSSAHKGRKKPWAGRYERTPEIKMAISVRTKLAFERNGDAIKLKMSIAHKGKKHSEEAIKNMVEAQKMLPSYKGGAETRRARKCFYQRQREYRKKANGGSHSLQEWVDMKKLYQFTCPCCLLSEPLVFLTEDHIVPLTKGGSNSIDNIQPLCMSCNSKKRTKTIKYETYIAAK